MSSIKVKRVFDESEVEYLIKQVDKVILDKVVVDITEKRGFFPWSKVKVETKKFIEGNLEGSTTGSSWDEIFDSMSYGIPRYYGPTDNMSSVWKLVARMEKGDREFYLTPELADFIDLVWEL